MVEKNETIVVVGFGWVGQANALALLRMGYAVAFYDILPPKFHYSDEYYNLYEQLVSLNHPLQQDGPNTWYLVCVGDRVDTDGHQDISLIKGAVESLREAQGKVILRSTILPDSLQELRFDFYVPEFLHEVRAVEESLNPYYFVLGQRDTALEVPSFLAVWEERAYKVFKGTPEEASHIKYLSNIWNAVRIAFVNEFGDSITLPATTEERKRVERITDFIFDRKSYLRYGRSFGGHCLPKDLRAYTALKRGQFPVPLLEGIAAANAEHIRVEERYQTLPQWFSTWDYQGYRGVRGAFLKLWDSFNRRGAVRGLRRVVKPIILKVEHLLPAHTLAKTKERWNNFAVTLPYYYTNPDTSSGKRADEFEIRRTGQEDYEKYIAGDKDIGNAPEDKNILEIGVGVGRVTEYLAQHFKTVHGLDISNTMLAIARKRLSQYSNMVLEETSGNSIPFPDNYFDTIFSYQTFKYLSSPILMRDYWCEIQRTLKPGGVAKIHLRTGPEVHRWRWFYGHSFTPQVAGALAEAAGLTVLRTEQENAKSLWVWLKKKF